jgi:hypothetical protein
MNDDEEELICPYCECKCVDLAELKAHHDLKCWVLDR